MLEAWMHDNYMGAHSKLNTMPVGGHQCLYSIFFFKWFIYRENLFISIPALTWSVRFSERASSWKVRISAAWWRMEGGMDGGWRRWLTFSSSSISINFFSTIFFSLFSVSDRAFREDTWEQEMSANYWRNLWLQLTIFPVNTNFRIGGPS